MSGTNSHLHPRHMTRYLLSALVFACCIFTQIPRASAENQVVDRIVAMVNDDIIVLQDINQLVEPIRDNLMKSGQPTEKAEKILYEKRNELLGMMIDQKLMLQSTKLYNITVGDKEVDSAIERMKEANQLTDESLRAALQKQGTSMAAFRRSFREQILLNRIEHIEVRSRIVITDADVQAYYERHADRYGSAEKYHLRHLMMAVSPYAEPDEKAAIYRKMEAAQTALASGELFVDVVKRHADREYVAEGGELGLFELADLTPRLKAAVAKLAVGQSTPILETERGYQILHLEEIVQTQATPLSEVAEEIKETLFNETLAQRKREWIEGLRNRAHIKIIN